MHIHKPLKGNALLYIIMTSLVFNVIMFYLFKLVNSYVLLSMLKLILVVINVYLLYNIGLSLSLNYSLDKDNIIIISFWGLRKIVIPFNNILGYSINKERIRGVKLSGIGNERFFFGRNIIDKIGTTHMFVTHSKTIIYLKTSKISYAISPKNHEVFENALRESKIPDLIEDPNLKNNFDIYKEKVFLIPFISSTVLIIILTLNPFILYLNHKLPEVMPLTFDNKFFPKTFGTGKQFAFKQMTYGVMNMVVLLCMYYASHFCAKYDKKAAYKYIYFSLALAVAFLLIQLRIIYTFH